MQKQQEEPEWFRNWFNHDYLLLYSHRDLAQARHQVELLLNHCSFDSSPLVLDVACGQGRHLFSLKEKNCRAFGFDLSGSLLKVGRQDGHSVAHADMRWVPFRPGTFDLVTSFFSSFGYFSNEKEDVDVLRGLSNLLNSKGPGYLFLDLMNKDYVVKNLVERNERVASSIRVSEERRLEGNVVVKQIKLEHPNGQRAKYEERVRLYSLEAMEFLCNQENLVVRQIFGDEQGTSFDVHSSKRMAILLEKK